MSPAHDVEYRVEVLTFTSGWQRRGPAFTNFVDAQWYMKGRAADHSTEYKWRVLSSMPTPEPTIEVEYQRS